MSQVDYYGVSLRGRGPGTEQKENQRMRIEDLLGVEALKPEEKKRLARLSEALIIILQTMVDAIRDEDEKE